MKNLSMLFIFSFLYILFFAGCNSYSSKASLVEAVEMDNVKLVKYLIKQGHSALTFDEKTHKFPFEAACIHGNPTIMKIFITKASNSIPPSFLRTCIETASKEGHNKVLELLLQEINRRKLSLDDSINVALQKAASIGHSSVVKLLLDSKKISQYYKNRALIAAIELGNEKIIKLLLNKGAHVNALTVDDIENPLSMACKMKKISIVNILIQSGAIINLKNGEGKTPLQIARENGFSEIEQLLLKAGAK